MNERIDDDYSDFMITDQKEIQEFLTPAKEYFIYTTAIVNGILNTE